MRHVLNTKPDTASRDPDADWSSYLGCALVVVLVIIHCVAVLHYTSRHGRISIVPIYDDSTYLVDALKRLPVFDQGGVWALLTSFAQASPHAPYSTILALFGFLLTPHSMTGAYGLSAVWVVIFLVLLDGLNCDLPRLTRFGIMIAALTVPMLAIVIGSFRPDTYWGLVTGLTAVRLATVHFTDDKAAAMLATGLLVGFAALTKPTGLPAGSVVMATGYLGALFSAFLLQRITLVDALEKTAFLLAGVALVLVPFLATGWRDLFNYIWTVLVAEKNVWQTQGSISEHLLYYIRSDTIGSMIGWLVVAGPLAFIGSLCATSRTSFRSALLSHICVFLVVLVAYLIPSLSPVKSVFIGSLFYGTVVAASFWCVGRILSVSAAPGRAVLALGALVFIVSWRPGAPAITVESQYYAGINSATRAVTPAILSAMKALRSQGTTSPKLYTSSPGPVFAATLEYEALLEGIEATFTGDYTNGNRASLFEAAHRADIVVASEAGALGQGGGFAYPGIQYQGELIQALSADDAWYSIAIYSDENGRRTFVFSRVILGSWQITSGAYSQEVLGDGSAFRWMTPNATLRIFTPERKGACVTLDLFGTTLPNTDGDVIVSRTDGSELRVSLTGTNLHAPKRLFIGVPQGRDETEMAMASAFPAIQFPNDPRLVAFGLRVPLQLRPRSECLR